MKAARYYGRGQIQIDNIPEPTLTPGSVGIEVAWCGICGTDLHEYLEGPIFCPQPGQRHAASGESLPVTLGHEFSGTVYAVGPGVEDIAPGQRVVVEPYIVRDDVDTGPTSKDYHLSKDLGVIGLSGRGGGLGERIVVEQRWVHPIPDSLPLDQAALVEPLSVAYHAVERSEVSKGAVAVVGGAGPIGLLTSAVLKALGATVIVSELSSLRRQKALDTGVADYVLDPREIDVTQEVFRLTEGRGADVAFECSSAQPVLDTLVDALKPAGILVVIGIWGDRAGIDMFKIVVKEIDLRGAFAYVNSYPAVIKLLGSGAIDLQPFVTHRIGLDGLISEGFDTLLHHSESAVKIIVSPSGKGL
ncbi:2,3-butanediol dehydrogenase [Paenarthrobacter sp. NPDC091669]|uniref:2,3-butanediol dehydrogenase n=1 Tax=Paenarthrobacter sp. NPDC091669 TaxID=3364384 RepID=UPI00381250B8